MDKNIELDTKILNKNLEITKLTKQIDDLTSELVDLKEKSNNNMRLSDDNNLCFLLKEVHEMSYGRMEFSEKLQPLDDDLNNVDNKTHFEKELTLYKLTDEMVWEDQTGRSILKDLRKVIRSLNKKIGLPTDDFTVL